MSQHDDPEICASAAAASVAAGAVLLDIRSAVERAGGMAQGAQGVDIDALDAWLARAPRAPLLLLICAVGQRSLRAAQALRARGIAAQSVSGGLQAWIAAGLPMAGDDLDADARERYARQLRLPEVGVRGQARLARARVAVVGAGGLGSPTALYLAAAGVGTLSLIDDDVVERSNLQRQVLHSDARVGTLKVASAAAALHALNPRTHIETHAVRLNADNAAQLLVGHDLLIDGADNFAARYAVGSASLRLGLPMIYGAVERYSGQVSVFDPRRADSPCYRCLFPYPPAAGEAPSCAEAGVLGVLPGVIGLLQATEALKLLLDLGAPLIGRLLLFDALAMRFRELALPRDAHCPGCGADAQPLDAKALQDLCQG
ncbi:molybdopterin-synthase adenylyltransferase MoeB [Metallibacterium sp.]|uniref:molybdopterin-synthase adenylyltransferase MoeB n=1 Tax=Metallibacterium sp. TaxID=2940281 RepID=UPI002604B9EC|nr:molybdopterin-synthase adenylyltransferase MoeB [Metallibacterium sp.]